MSDLQSVPPVDLKNAGLSLAEWVDANVVLQKLLQNLAAEDRNKLILRCDALPLIAGNAKDLDRIFQVLLQMILQKKSEVSALFLHISCVEDEANGSTTGEIRFFTIQFNTNIIPSNQWFETNKATLDELEAVVAGQMGKLVSNAFRPGGCIFSVSLPGKAL